MFFHSRIECVLVFRMNTITLHKFQVWWDCLYIFCFYNASNLQNPWDQDSDCLWLWHTHTGPLYCQSLQCKRNKEVVSGCKTKQFMKSFLEHKFWLLLFISHFWSCFWCQCITVHFVCSIICLWLICDYQWNKSFW